MKEKVNAVLEKHQARIAAGVQLVLCTLAIRSVVKKDLKKMKKKYKKQMKS